MTRTAIDLGWGIPLGLGSFANRRTRRQRGLTLIEAATVLAILAFVVAGIMQLYTAADGSRKTTAALSELASIQQSVRSVYGGQATYNGLNTEAMVNSAALPSKMISGTTMKHSFGGNITVSAADAGGGAASGFEVVFTNIPKDPCVKILVSDLGRGLFSVGTSSSTRTSDSGTPPPFDPASAAEACAHGSSNTITWVFN